MPRERKTIDTWDIETFYGGEWSSECTEFTLHSARRQLACYRENVEAPVRIKHRRLKKADHTPEELESFAACIEEARAEDKKLRAAARERRRDIARQADRKSK